MKKMLLSFIFLMFFCCATTCADQLSEITMLWNDVLKENVSVSEKSGIALNVVNYDHLKKNDTFDRLISKLANVSINKIEVNDARKKAFWINVYNILAVDLVRRNYPLKSIKDIGSVFHPVWKMEAGIVGGKAYSLDHIEHSILRKMGDPRIHGAIVCASVSCPDLRNESFVAERLDSQLDDQMRYFLDNSNKGSRIDTEKKVFYVSRIFKWFADDFKLEGGIPKALYRYLPESKRFFLTKEPYSVNYFNYDWNLNDRR